MPVTLDPSVPIENLVQKHFTPESKQELDNYFTQINAAQKSGKLGSEPDEQYSNIVKLMQNKYPQFMNDLRGLQPETGKPLPPDPKTGNLFHPYDLAQSGEFRQYLADRGIMEQPKTAGQEYAYPALAAGAEAAGAVTGGIIGVGGGPLGTAVGAGTGAMIAQGLAKPALRSAFGLPQESGPEQAQNAAVSFGVNSIFDLLGQAGSKAFTAAKKTLFFGNNPHISGDMLEQLDMLQQGANLAGNNTFPSLTALTRAQRIGTETPPTFRDSFTNLVNSALFSSNIVERRAVTVQQAQNALVTDFTRQLGLDGALTDSSQAAKTFNLLRENNYQLSRTVRRQIYDGAETFPGSSDPNLLTDDPISFFKNDGKRIDLAELASDIERKTNMINKKPLDYLVTEVPVSNNTPIGTPLPSYDTSQFAQILQPVNQAAVLPGSSHILSAQNVQAPYVIPNSATFQGINPQTGQAMIQVQTQTGPSISLPHPGNIADVTYQENRTSYRNIRELRSLLGKYANEMSERASQSGTAAKIHEYGVYARDARHAIQMLNDASEDAASSGSLPRTTLQAYQYADKLAGEEIRTFENKLFMHIVQTFESEPQKFAEELLKPHNAETLKAIQKAADSFPDVTTPHTGMSQAQLATELGRDTLYKQGVRTWETKMRPQLQAEFMKDSVEAQSGTAFESAIGQGPLMAGRNQADIHPDNIVVLNPAKFRQSLETGMILDPERRQVIFGSEQNYNRWLTMSKMLENFEKKRMTIRAGIGSFMAVSRQSAGITMMGYTALRALQGDDPNLGLFALGAGLLVSPIVLARYINNPTQYKALVLGLKQTPENFIKTRVARTLAQESVEQYYQEGNKRYPVASGESPQFMTPSR